MMAAGSFLKVSGRFYRSVLTDRIDHVLTAPGPASAGRYHRPGQPTIYITSEADWAVIATGIYAEEDGRERVIVPLELDSALVLDQRDTAVRAAYGISLDDAMTRWRPHLAEGRDAPSWRNADAARASGADGIVDPSRGIVDGWHVALFRWNAPGAPQLRVAGDPLSLDYATSRARWPAPVGWRMAG
jgi:RES domain-containing protein